MNLQCPASSSGRPVQPFRPATKCRQVRASATTEAHERSDQNRRRIIGGLAAFLAIPVRQANAGFGWDGSSAAVGSCAIGDEGAECRTALLQKDSKNKAAYPSSQQEGRPQSNVMGIPVAEMKDDYSLQTAKLGESVEQYFTLDPFDPQRPKLVKELKTEGGAWAAKYARGGSARKLSARKFYIVVDALQGHFTSNGLAPLPPKKVNVLKGNIEETRALLAKGQ